MNTAIFITSHNRADKVMTYNTLKKGGYTGRVFIVIDDEDEQLDLYVKNYGSAIIVYNKEKAMSECDTVINTGLKKSVTFARIAVEKIAQKSNLDAFAILDDDILNLRYRIIEDGKVKSMSVRSGLDKVFEYYYSFMLQNDIAVTSFCSPMFYVAGTHNLATRLTKSREAYQIFLRNPKFKLNWVGVMRQDMLTNSLTEQIGYVWLTLPYISYDAIPMNEFRSNIGGMHETYQNMPEYVRAMLGVIVHPSSLYVRCNETCTKIGWIRDNGLPCIISSRFKK